MVGHFPMPTDSVSTDLAVSTAEALYMVDRLDHDLILSDTNRQGNPVAGRELLDELLRRSSTVPMIYYVGQADRRQGTPIGAFAITNRPDEVLHLVFGALERRRVEAG
jgi:DNA-binding NtrC family response regulator